MASEGSSLLFLEYRDEAEAFLSNGGSKGGSLGSPKIVGLNPMPRAYLKRHGQVVENTIPYLTPSSRTRAVGRAAELTRWMQEHINFQDNWGVRTGYEENLVWYTRWFVHYLLWSLEILDNAVAESNARTLLVYAPASPQISGPFTGIEERYFSAMAGYFAAGRGLEYCPLPINARSSRGQQAMGTLRHLARMLAPNPLVSWLHRRPLRRLAGLNTVLFTSPDYRMNVLAERIRQEQGVVPVLLNDWSRQHPFGWPIRTVAGHPFAAEASLCLLDPSADEDQSSRRRLEEAIEGFARDISEATDVFSHLGVSFADIVGRKVRYGIGPVILGLHQRTATIRMLLHTLRPQLVFSNGCRLDDVITGELCREAGIPSLMITHGSHTPIKDDAELYEWGDHGRRILNAPYDFTALQSPLAEGFRKEVPSDSEGLRTGPLIWAAAGDRRRSAALRARMLGDTSEEKVVVHAGTPKANWQMRFHVYETLDEYIQGIQELADAVEQLPGVRLIVKFRPSAELSLEDLTALVDFKGKSMVSVDESLLDVMGFTDLLVSFSSTVIEEALQNRVPVLLYGGDGRYQHIKAPLVTEGDSPGTSALYHVRDAKDLPYALEQILSVLSKDPPSEEMFAPYVYAPEQMVQLPEVIQLMGEHMRAAPRKG